jgi:hypothetical protein
MMWRNDPEIAAARKLPGWPPFHRVCGKIGLFFDHMVQEGRRGQYTCDAFTLKDRCPVKLATGRGKTVIASVVDAYHASGRSSPDTEAALGVLLAEPERPAPPPPVDDFDTLLVDDFEEFL